MRYSPVEINVPDIQSPFVSGNYNYSNPQVKASNIRMIQEINRKYGSLASYWGQIFEIPKGIIIGFIATESGGQMLPPNRFSATGLMQVTPPAVYDSVTKWQTEVRSPLPVQATNVIRQKIPALLTSSLSSVRGRILTLLQNDANFNIMAGTLYLRWLIERFSVDGGRGQLNKAIVAYNAGAYLRSIVCSLKINDDKCKATSRPDLTPIDSTTLSISRSIPTESRGYLLKTLGKDGFFQLIYKDRAI